MATTKWPTPLVGTLVERAPEPRWPRLSALGGHTRNDQTVLPRYRADSQCWRGFARAGGAGNRHFWHCFSPHGASWLGDSLARRHDKRQEGAAARRAGGVPALTATMASSLAAAA